MPVNPQDMQFLKDKAKEKGMAFGKELGLFQRLFRGANAPVKVEEVINHKLDVADSERAKQGIQIENIQKALNVIESKINTIIQSIDNLKGK